MIVKTGVIAARMNELGLEPSEVAARMRRAGLPGTRGHWVDAVARGVWTEMPEPWVQGLARALRCEAGELLGRPRLRLVKAPGDR